MFDSSTPSSSSRKTRHEWGTLSAAESPLLEPLDFLASCHGDETLQTKPVQIFARRHEKTPPDPRMGLLSSWIQARGASCALLSYKRKKPRP